MPLTRYLEKPILHDLGKKMVFLAGPRQVGKTTLALSLLKKAGAGTYYLWDNHEDRKAIFKAQWPLGSALIVLDELHKYRRWKGWLKGEYDKHRERLRFLVTGSARMDIYRKGGDSLQGRYHHYRLHPFSQRELTGEKIGTFQPGEEIEFGKPLPGSLERLLKFSGFPEPIVAQSDSEHRRWQKERLERFYREDVRDLENVRDLSSMQILADLLPERVGSLLSLNSLREDLEISHKAVSHWVEILERLYYLFRIRPFTTRRIRGIKKEPKAYLWDWTLVTDPDNRFENLIASHLLKFCHYLEDREGYRTELCFLRDTAKREVDFLIIENGKPWFAVEAKASDDRISPHLRYFGERLRIPYLYQVVFRPAREYHEGAVQVVSAARFLSALP